MSPSIPPWPSILILQLFITIMQASSSCPVPCQCKWLQGKNTLNCVEKNITYIPLTNDDAKIEAVMLDRNDLNQLEGYEFVNAGLAHVRKLTMRYCKLDSFKEDLFSGLTNLHHLDLSHNSLTLLPSHQIPALPALRSLDLSHNLLHNIHKDSFYNLGSSLERIDLRGNFLTSIPWMTFLPLPKLRQLTLANNPWHCDCQLGELHSDLTRRNIVPSKAACFSPQSLSTRHWSTFHSSDFTCPPTVSLPHHQTVLPGQVVPLHCQVTGNPTPTVTWRQHGQTLPQPSSGLYSIRHTKSGEGHGTKIFSILTIMNMSTSSLGLYTCLAKNVEGVDEKELRISYIDSINVVAESEEKPVVLIIAISASTAIIVIITLMLVVLCFVRKLNALKSSSHSNSFTILDYSDKRPSKDREKLRSSWTNPMPKPPRTGAYDQMSCEDIPGTLSRSSTRQTYLLADTCDGDTNNLSGDDYAEATLPRSDTDWTRSHYSTPLGYNKTPIDPLDQFPLLSNRPGSRASIGTISSVSTIDPVYGYSKHPYLPQYGYLPQHQPMLSANSHQRPGYVTLPRRPKPSQRPALSLGDCLGPRSSADGCSHSNISTLPSNKSMEHHCQSTTVLPPYSPPPPASITAINTVGLPPVQFFSPEEDNPMRTSTPKTALDLSLPPSSRAHLDTIPEQE